MFRHDYVTNFKATKKQKKGKSNKGKALFQPNFIKFLGHTLLNPLIYTMSFQRSEKPPPNVFQIVHTFYLWCNTNK